jgi:hypothetical protein
MAKEITIRLIDENKPFSPANVEVLIDGKPKEYAQALFVNVNVDTGTAIVRYDGLKEGNGRPAKNPNGEGFEKEVIIW